MPNKYKVIYADPPWSFKTFSYKGKRRSADAHYKCLNEKDLQDLPVADFADNDCALFLWATDPLLPSALDLIRAWGFKYKTVGFYWAKLNTNAPSLLFTEIDFFVGLGYWTRANSELCLLATKGRPLRKQKNVRRLLIAQRRQHSRKPDEVYERIERLVDGPYLELFARSTRPGWHAWGDEIGLLDEGPVQTRQAPSSAHNRADEEDASLMQGAKKTG